MVGRRESNTTASHLIYMDILNRQFMRAPILAPTIIDLCIQIILGDERGLFAPFLIKLRRASSALIP